MSRVSLSRRSSEGRIGARIGPPRAAPRRRNGFARLGRATLVAGLALLAVLAFAFVDGGEEPIRPIAEPVDLAERAR
ncbi:hypothetical protein [Erythrobacter sp. HL-111]|uniref:hypothetical protein n=1 Tax=Erythrobacter sp. HL-111 TaxID=1798193 RepID=UPI0006DB8291|nr:hypothetical protein [Erythrobacter sp. HL-111]KPP90303.1 MAG: Anti-sigma-K factor rskA [Erythrobacteraceae bacterium HL-111]SDR83852.1 hypothetical protein SAMN04515621_0477 [Erythrobacter sp. HL-111]